MSPSVSLWWVPFPTCPAPVMGGGMRWAVQHSVVDIRQVPTLPLSDADHSVKPSQASPVLNGPAFRRPLSVCLSVSPLSQPRFPPPLRRPIALSV